jgi:hypothetical protein
VLRVVLMSAAFVRIKMRINLFELRCGLVYAESVASNHACFHHRPLSQAKSHMQLEKETHAREDMLTKLLAAHAIARDAEMAKGHDSAFDDFFGKKTPNGGGGGGNSSSSGGIMARVGWVGIENVNPETGVQLRTHSRASRSSVASGVYGFGDATGSAEADAEMYGALRLETECCVLEDAVGSHACWFFLCACKQTPDRVIPFVCIRSLLTQLCGLLCAAPFPRACFRTAYYRVLLCTKTTA